MQCIVYMGKTDVERQHINVEKMKMLGAEVRPVTSGNMTLKEVPIFYDCQKGQTGWFVSLKNRTLSLYNIFILKQILSNQQQNTLTKNILALLSI